MTEHDNRCDRQLHAHVRRNPATGRYHAELRCACMAVSRLGRTGHVEFAAAMTAARGTLASHHRRREAAKTRRPRPIAPIPAPTDAEVRAAFVAYWRGVCASNGHESRL